MWIIRNMNSYFCFENRTFYHSNFTWIYFFPRIGIWVDTRAYHLCFISSVGKRFGVSFSQTIIKWYIVECWERHSIRVSFFLFVSSVCFFYQFTSSFHWHSLFFSVRTNCNLNTFAHFKIHKIQFRHINKNKEMLRHRKHMAGGLKWSKIKNNKIKVTFIIILYYFAPCHGRHTIHYVINSNSICM